MQQNSSSTSSHIYPARLCPACRNVNDDWTRYCAHCGVPMPDPVATIMAEIGHIAYLQQQMRWWRSRQLIPAAIETQLAAEYADRQRTLLAQLPFVQAATPPAPATSIIPLGPEPIVPPLPEAVVHNWAASPSSVTLPQAASGIAGPVPPVVGSDGKAQSAPGPGVSPALSRPIAAHQSPPSPPSAPPLSAGLRNFFQAHGLKVLFALATVLVVVALRSMIAWDWVGAVAMRLIPAVPLGLTVMFWMFGQQTRRENPWAALIYHGLATTLFGFDVIAINKYWLFGLLTAKPAAALACLVAIAAAGGLLARLRETSYLHLFQIGMMAALYSALQLLRPAAVPLNDFRPSPVWLFGGGYLLYAALCVGMARTMRYRSGQESAAETWAPAWMLWAHLSVAAVTVVAALDLALRDVVLVSDLAPLTLIAGLIYAAGAQALAEARMVYVSGGLLVGSGALWLTAPGLHLWPGAGLLLLALSSVALVLALFNRRQAADGSNGELADAWRRVSRAGVGLATALIWTHALLLLATPATFPSVADPGMTALLALVTGGFYLFFAWEASETAYLYGALGCAGYASTLLARRLLPVPPTLTDCLAPFALASAAGAYVAARASKLEAEADTQAGKSGLNWSVWREPLAASALLTIALSIAYGLSMLTGRSSHLALSLLPSLIASVFVCAARSKPSPDPYRTLGIGMLCATGALGTAGLCDLAGALRLPFLVCGLVALAWLWWLLAQALPRVVKEEVWSEELAVGGLVTTFTAAGLALLALMHGHAKGMPLGMMEGSLAGAFAHISVDMAVKRRERAVLPSLLLVVLTGIANAAILSPAMPLALPCWTLTTLAVTGIYLGLAYRLEEADIARYSLMPLLGGYVLFAGWRASPLLSGVDAHLSDALWGMGGVLLAWDYVRAARWSDRPEFAYMAAVALAGSYVRSLCLLWQPPTAWLALVLLPFLIVLYVAGMGLAAREERLLGEPWQRTALALSGVALFWSAGNGDGLFLQANNTLPAHATALWLVTLTLAAYGMAYACVAFLRRTPGTVMAGAVTLTSAYLHHLLTRTTLFAPTPALSWPHFAFLAAQAGVFWLVIGWELALRWKQTDLAAPLLTLAGGLSLLSSAIGLMTVQTPNQGSWSILTLGWGGVIWFGLWLLEIGDLCLHVGVWNLLAAWSLILYHNFGVDGALMDLYLLPVGLYLIAIGHLAGSRRKVENAHLFWWSGLLLMMTPAFLAYWQRAASWHTLVLLSECLLAVLWGIGQRIRSFVCAGLLFAAAYAASAAIGRLPDTISTLASLLMGVSLFVIGFYILTHREVVQRWAVALEDHWHVWQAWR